MAQIFHRSMNTVAKASILGLVVGLVVVSVAACLIDRSQYVTRQGMVRPQPVVFSHQHHVRDLGLDCRYCHTSVTDSSFAGLPATKTCMTCHSRIWTDANLLEPVRKSWRDEIPIHWTRVHNLPDFVYFPHDIHVNKGVGCATCHGRVDQMPLMFQHASLQMNWCLDCHWNPGKYLRPRDQGFQQPSTDAAAPMRSGDVDRVLHRVAVARPLPRSAEALVGGEPDHGTVVVGHQHRVAVALLVAEPRPPLAQGLQRFGPRPGGRQDRRVVDVAVIGCRGARPRTGPAAGGGGRDVLRINVVAASAEQARHAREHAELVFHQHRYGMSHK